MNGSDRIVINCLTKNDRIVISFMSVNDTIVIKFVSALYQSGQFWPLEINQRSIDKSELRSMVKSQNNFLQKYRYKFGKSLF